MLEIRCWGVKKSLMSQPSDVWLVVYSACEPACLFCLQDLIRLLWPLHVGGAAVFFSLCHAGPHLGADRPLAAHGRCVSMLLLCVCVCACVWEENVNMSSGLPITTFSVWSGVILLIILWCCFLQRLPWVFVWP